MRRLPEPVVLVGSAGSDKTAVTLAKLREVGGNVLYFTQSADLAQSARLLHDAHGYENPAQEAAFLSYREFLETLHAPRGWELSFTAFSGRFARHHAAAWALGAGRPGRPRAVRRASRQRHLHFSRARHGHRLPNPAMLLRPE